MDYSNLLELDKILNILNEYAILDETKDSILNIELLNDKNIISNKLNEVEEALNMLYRFSDVDFDKFNLIDTIDRIRINSLLNISEIINVRRLISASNKFIEYKNKYNAVNDIIHLNGLFNSLDPLKELRLLIDSIVDYDGNINDNASPNLSRIRREIKRLESECINKLNDFIRKEKDKMAGDMITIRNGHHVIPLKSDFKSNVKGIIYDESSSGQTVFIEPFFASEIEGKIIVLKNEEEKEIQKILYELSNSISSYYELLINSYLGIKDLDLIFSKAKFAKEYNCSKPILDEHIELLDARHPLIDKDKIVPNDIILDKKMMIITGPNTGGKTVVLKTLGLLSLMVKCSLLIPVKEGSKIRIFNDVLADIGDEQSIEQSLSTFSSHMKRIVDIIDNHKDNSLILFDELGSGTDPKEGASLGIAILKYLINENCFTVCTTHYPELKSFAYSEDNIINASVLFDVNSLMPTYKLLIGSSGSSNAFLISEKLGLNKSIIDSAKSLSFEFKDESSTFINKLEKEANKLRVLKDDLYNKKAELKDGINHYKELLKGLKEKEAKLNNDIEVKKNLILSKAQDECNKLLEEVKSLKNGYNANEFATLKGKTNNLIIDKEIKSNEKKELKVHDNVRILSLNTTGEIIEIKNNKYIVLIGSIKSTFNKSDLEYVKIKDYKETILKDVSNGTINVNGSSRLDLRGERYEEALKILEKFISDAIYLNLDEVTVIHGFGSLALRNMVIDYCKTHKEVKRYRSGEEHEGGRGVTIIYL